jgi:ParB family transcriptional regulator, chromosome partitioning protein
MSLKRGLGSNLNNLGLGELLSNLNNSNSSNGNDAAADKNNNLKKVPIDVLSPGKYQPRGKMNVESLQELADSIRAQGIIQPIVVRNKAGVKKSATNKTDSVEYEIIAGERRWRAAQLAGIDKVPVIVRELNDEQASAIALIENMQREDLNVIDVAFGLKRLIDEFGLTHQDAAKVIGKSRVSVTNLIRLLDLNDEVKNMVRCGDLEMGHARALLTLTSPKQLQLAKIIVERGMSVRGAENLAAAIHKPKTTSASSAQNDARDPNILQLQNQLKSRLNAKVDIKHQQSGKGKLVVHYFSLDELEGILSKINPM